MAAFTYNENDQIASRKNNDGTLSLFAYNGAGDLVKQTIYDKYGNPIDSFSYTYDTKGNITSITSKSGTTTYEYDELDQLIKETAPDGTITEYTYDAAGNRTSKKVTRDGSTTTTTYTYDDVDQLTAVNGQAYTYDKNGNLTNDGSKTYAYDAENRLTRVQSGSDTVQFAYRADGMRTSMTTSTGTTYFHYDENKNVSFETNTSGQVVASYTFDGENRPVSMTKDGQTYYFQLNGQGDVIALTDANGNVVATYAYDAYGRITSHTGTFKSPYLYRGYRYDWETGLYYLQSRYYNPDMGRFLTRDTDSGEEMEPLTLNKYIYAVNNPVMNVDSDGNFYKTLKGYAKRVMRWLVNVIFREFIMKPVTVALSFFFPWLRTYRALRALRTPILVKHTIIKLSRTSFGRRVWRSIKAGFIGVFYGGIGVSFVTAANRYLNPDRYFLRTRVGRIYVSRMTRLKNRVLRMIG
ncbi:MAG: RHS repeat-associated core domain-containing protein [Thermoactinomyces sp.]|uniref:Teneurin-like YD-shell domain-containing protein n=1 Tax=Thermoactinomyces mirandus TaxID=2756294 RepID=A0A7W1XQ25_9BACL|nr:hypothetical protein [Thermoactinomyces mirandus]